MITVYDSQGNFVPYDNILFSGGEVHIRMKKFFHDGTMKIVAHIRSSGDVMKLFMITDALRREGVKEIDLVCPYFPYARQDRVCNEGEALGARVMADLINSQGYRSVEIWDAHSDVSTALLNNCKNIPQSHFLKDLYIDPKTILIAPDSGAIKKTHDLAVSKNGMSYFSYVKHRDTKTGEVLSIHPVWGGLTSEYITDKSYLIIDDICDGGRTFLEVAKSLRGWTGEKIHLYVTHGIFSRGFDELRTVIDHVYCANIWPDRFKGNEDFVTVLTRG